MNVDGVTKRKVEKDAADEDDCGTMVVSDIVLGDAMGCKAVITSDFGTAENVTLAFIKSVESRAIRLLG